MVFGRHQTQKSFKKTAWPHLDFLYSMALRYADNSEDAEDLVQETLTIAFDKFHQLKDRTKCKAWLFRILRNTFLRQARQKKRLYAIQGGESPGYVELLEAEADSSDSERLLVSALDSRMISNALDRLPEKHRTVLLLFYMEEMLYREIAEMLDIPVGTVMSRLTRGRERLKREFLKLRAEKPSAIVELKKTASSGS